MAILSKACKPDNFEFHNSLKLSFTYTWGLHSNFVDCESFVESNSWHSCSAWDKPGWLNWLNWFTQCLTSFSSIDHLLCLCAWFWFYFIWHKWSSLNQPIYCFVFGDFNAPHKDWLIYSGGTDWPGELYYNFSISNDLTHMVNFPTQIPDWYPQSCPFGFISFFWCQSLFYIGFLSIGELWSCCCLSFHLIFIKFTMGCPVSLHSLWLFLCWLGWSLWSFERCSIGGYL